MNKNRSAAPKGLAGSRLDTSFDSSHLNVANDESYMSKQSSQMSPRTLFDDSPEPKTSVVKKN